MSCRCHWVFFDLCLLHTLRLSCFERNFILLFPLVGEIITFQLFCGIFMSRCITSLKSETEQSHASTSQPFSPSGSQSIDGSITWFLFGKACGNLTIYIWTRSPCIKYVMIWIENNSFSLPRYIWVPISSLGLQRTLAAQIRQDSVSAHLLKHFHHLSLNISNECGGKNTQPRQCKITLQ